MAQQPRRLKGRSNSYDDRPKPRPVSEEKKKQQINWRKLCLANRRILGIFTPKNEKEAKQLGISI
jgi:hypothetical protein